MPINNIYIIVLNWNGAADTIACLDSLVRLKGPQANIIVCDNHSSDGSYTIIKDFIIDSVRNRQKDWHGFHFFEFKENACPSESALETGVRFVGLVRTDENLGFAGGVNIGIRIALLDPTMKYIWILNNDTVVDKNALFALVAKMNSNPAIGVCGSTLLYYGRPTVIQAVGGIYNAWLGTTRHVLGQQNYAAELCQSINAFNLDYLVGASLFIRRELLERVGLLSEDYFLYCEELDWFHRMKRIAPEFKLGYAPESLVYHKEGASTGSNDLGRKTYSYFADYFYMTSRLKFSKRYFPYRYWLVRLATLGLGINRLRRHQFRSFMLAIFLVIGWVPRAFIPTHT